MLAPPANCEGNVVLRSPRRRTWGGGVEVVGRDTPSTSRHPRPPSSVIPDPDRGPTPASLWPLIRDPLLSRHSGPRAGTQGTGAETTTTIIPHQHPHTPLPSIRPPSRNLGDGRGNHHNRHPQPTPPYRRAGVGRYPGDGRGYPHKHPKNQTAHTHSTVVPGSDLTPPRTTHQHPPTIPPSFWPPSVFPDPDPEPKGAARLPSNRRPRATLRHPKLSP